jgi:hypothetical protein
MESKTDPEASNSSSSGSDGSLTASEKLLIGAPNLGQEPDSGNILDHLVQIMDSIVTSLYKISTTIQNPANRDRTARAAKINVSFWKDIDQRHVLDKFPKCSDQLLLKRLAEANTKRRQLFAYHKRHKDKIQYFEDTAVRTISTHEPAEAERRGDLPRTLAPAPTVYTSNSKLTKTTVSTVKPEIKRMTASVSGRSQRTHISRDPDSNKQDSVEDSLATK